MQITFVGFQPVQSSEHMAAFGIFGLLQLHAGLNWARFLLPSAHFNRLLQLSVITAISSLLLVGTIGTLTGYISPFTGRFYTLLDPTYAKKHIPIIASVSEHQPTSWSSYFFDLHFLTIMFPVGIYFCFSKLTDVNIFVILYGVTSVYFSGVMVRLMLILAPIMCISSAIGVSATLTNFVKYLKEPSSSTTTTTKSSSSKEDKEKELRVQFAFLVTLGITILLSFFVFHSCWVTSEAYSSPSIVLSARGHDGHPIIFDDFREAYNWLKFNTKQDARVMSWWDYGYQISAMANRTVLVDNNTWNNSHIAQVGKAFASTEENAYKIMQQLDVDYILVIFGGMIGYASDDINKFLWMVRIAGSTDPNVIETDYYSTNGEYRIDKEGSATMLNTLMYKCCYWNFGYIHSETGKPPGWDRVRDAEIGNKFFQLDYIQEAFTTQHWLVRIYRVLPPTNRS
jgi:dolichyl-diphosphooligosaccharide--protein glycosyltransferase